MLGIFKPATNLELYINSVFTQHKTDIVNTFLLQVKDEQLKGESCKQYRNFDIFLATYLVVLVYQDFIKHPDYDWSYFENKYNLKTLKTCLGCNGVDLNTILTSFQLPVVFESGINGVEIQISEEVEPTSIIIPTSTPINILEYINLNTCINKISKIC